MGDLLTIAEVAERLRLTERTVYKLVTAGDLPGHKIGRVWRVDEDDLLAFLDKTRRAK